MATVEVVGINGETILSPVTLPEGALVSDVVNLIHKAGSGPQWHVKLLYQDQQWPDDGCIEKLLGEQHLDECHLLTAIAAALSEEDRARYFAMVRKVKPPCHLEQMFKGLPDAARADVDLVREFVKRDGRTFRHVYPSLFKNRDVVMDAVCTSRQALAFADRSFRRDREVVLRATEHFADALEYADKELMSDPNFLHQAVHKSGEALAHVPKAFKEDPGIVRAAMQENGMALRHVSSAMQKEHRDVVMQAVQQIGHALKHADYSLHEDKDLVLSAVRRSGTHALKHIHSKLKRDSAVLMAAGAGPRWN
eukprot:TRINITY_DN64032_c0_g1_i1.p1 TRINITY_DN64032_c0_g1~~TRINITY_DN64032_c0_g1_i1.p1  ORF type:complete len:308 (+),score=59.23 TRINITY_DN64032_c0_g1_i1:71-994(+)